MSEDPASKARQDAINRNSRDTKEKQLGNTNDPLPTGQAVSLRDLHNAHDGKVSDKWSSYLDAYDRLFSTRRNNPVRLLEIGVQNGGSLEVWRQYFSEAELIVGCDINPACQNLAFGHENIHVVVGDANSDQVEGAVVAKSEKFDIIIDDGSHTSSDIICTFARYFRHLCEGGIYLIEDLHGSYWREFEGGLYDPLSSMSFLKRVLDLVNHEHWGLNRNRLDALAPFTERYGVAFNEASLMAVHSVTFLNSLCIIEKRPPQTNVLGERSVAGRAALVVEGLVALNGAESSAADQSSNPWSLLTATMEEEIGTNRELVRVQEERITTLSAELERKTSEMKALEHLISTAAQERDLLQSTLAEIYQSTSWRISGPIRTAKRILRSFGR